jgi:hypothetical protein
MWVFSAYSLHATCKISTDTIAVDQHFGYSLQNYRLSGQAFYPPSVFAGFRPEPEGQHTAIRRNPNRHLE